MEKFAFMLVCFIPTKLTNIALLSAHVEWVYVYIYLSTPYR